jgi:hypothetical protein
MTYRLRLDGPQIAAYGECSMVYSSVDYREYPASFTGRRRYVWTADHGVVAYCHVYRGHDGRYYLLEDDRGIPKQSGLSAPYVVRDITPYKSPIDNTMVTSRSAHREHLKVHDVIELGNERVKPVSIPTADYGRAISDRLAAVKEMPQAEYDRQVLAQSAEHTAIADMIVGDT